MNILRNLRGSTAAGLWELGRFLTKPTKIACHTCYGKFTSSMYLNIIP